MPVGPNPVCISMTLSRPEEKKGSEARAAHWEGAVRDGAGGRKSGE